MLGDRDSVLSELFKPVLGLLSVAVFGSELSEEDVVCLTHLADGSLGVLVQSESLGELEENGGGVDGILAKQFLTDGEGGLEPLAGVVVLLEVLQHHGSVVHRGDGVGVVRTVDDLPDIHGVLDVNQSGLSVARGMLK